MANEIILPSAAGGQLAGDRLSIIYCRNSQGAEVRGTLLRMTRHSAVFEVYNPYSILQLSEVLTEFQISSNERLLYSGRAVISNLVNAGIMLVLEAALEEDGWRDVDVFNPLLHRLGLRTELAEFMEDSKRIFRVLPDYKVIVSDIQTLLTDLRRWMEQVELCIRSLPAGDHDEAESYAIEEIEAPVLPALWPLFLRFEQVAGSVPEDLTGVHRSYVKRQLHPLVLCSPFTYRTFQKPLGYAGDYEMVSMMLRNPYEGSTVFAKVLNRVFLESPTVVAHRNRITYLHGRILEEVRAGVVSGRRVSFMNLGCGPAQEVQRFLERDEISDAADFTLFDFNDETLDYTTATLNELKARHGRTTGLNLQKKSVQHILKEGARGVGGGFDVVYCAGLFDYLSDRVCRRLLEIFYQMLAPGGLLIATNVHSANPSRQWMEGVMDWHLVYRDEAQFLALAPERAPEGGITVQADPTGVNIFLEVRKPVHDSTS
jgi:extracellular factor (EF) 3-hydroxypalmitic acid methyl ester biosynthesis protein